MTDREDIAGVHDAAKRREQADKARKSATGDLPRFIREARSAGVSISQIAREAALSRQGVYDLLATRPS
jgi:hypothetical protein